MKVYSELVLPMHLYMCISGAYMLLIYTCIYVRLDVNWHIELDTSAKEGIKMFFFLECYIICCPSHITSN